MINRQSYLFAIIATVSVAFFFSAPFQTALADSGTWDEHPQDDRWFNVNNWSSGSVPNGLNDVAQFGNSTITEVLAKGQALSLSELDFDADAPPYTITIDLPVFVTTIDGAGVTNNSANSHTIHLQDITRLNFVNSSSAGTGISYVIDSDSQLGFEDSATADMSEFAVDNATLSFDGESTAADAVITNTATVSLPGTTSFSDSSNGGNSTIVAMDGPVQGGAIYFFDGESQGTSGGTCKIQVFGKGLLDISPVALANGGFDIVTIGSLSGDGQVFLGSDNLTVGSDNLNTSFSGTMQDGGAAGRTGGSLSKIGSGILTLSGTNTYTGGTTVSAGTLLVKNRRGSATGTGAVQINAGSLSGKGTIAGAITIGMGNGAGANLMPGDNSAATSVMTVQSTLTFKADGTYTCKVNTGKGSADKVIASGVTIESGAKFAINVAGNKRLPSGTIFPVISNAGVSPINGTFGNLPDGAVFSVRRNTFKASYSGGDGNDLILTVQ